MSQIESMFQRSSRRLVGGVNSPVRAFNGVGGEPLFISRGHGAYLVDEFEREYVDYVGSWGPMIVGHAHPYIIEKVAECINNGLSFGAPTVQEINLAEKVCEFMPAIEQIRMVNSGTEATMSAIRLARGFTKKDKIIKFQGCYHGHSDALLVEAGSGALTLGVPSSAGVPESFTEHTLVASFNKLETVEELFAKFPNDIAAIIVEPIAGNMNCVLPNDGFLQGLRDLCDKYQSLLIFDEVMTGFRVAKGGAMQRYAIKPDLVTLGKIIGGGMPVGAFGGKEEIMSKLAPLGSVYQAGTLSGNPVAMTAGLATLELIDKKDFHDELEAKANILLNGLKERADAANVPFKTVVAGGMFGFFFTDLDQITTFQDVKKCDTEAFKKFFHGMLKEGIYFAPSAYEAGFISSAHTEIEIVNTLNAAEKVFNSSLS